MCDFPLYREVYIGPVCTWFGNCIEGCHTWWWDAIVPLQGDRMPYTERRSRVYFPATWYGDHVAKLGDLFTQDSLMRCGSWLSCESGITDICGRPDVFDNCFPCRTSLFTFCSLHFLRSDFVPILYSITPNAADDGHVAASASLPGVEETLQQTKR